MAHWREWLQRMLTYIRRLPFTLMATIQRSLICLDHPSFSYVEARAANFLPNYLLAFNVLYLTDLT